MGKYTCKVLRRVLARFTQLPFCFGFGPICLLNTNGSFNTTAIGLTKKDPPVDQQAQNKRRWGWELT